MGKFDHGEFLDLAYGAALDPDLWAPTLERFADAVGGQASWLSILSVVDGGGQGILARSDPAAVSQYFDYYAERNPLHRVENAARYLAAWTPRILTDEDWMPKEALTATEYYNDFMAPSDVHSAAMVRLGRRGDYIATINIGRPRRMGQFEAADLELAASLHPHLIRAFELGQTLAAERRLSAGFSTVFQESGHGLILLDRDGKVLHLNPAAEAMALAGRGLQVRGGRLVAPTTAGTRHLQTLVGHAGAREAASRTGGSMPLVVAEGRAPLSVTVAPARSTGLDLWNDGAAVVVCVTDTEAGVRLPEQMLRDLFGLTRSEARIALALFEGATPREAADRLGISPNTVQNHLARVFEKTGARRQSGLIRLMMGLVGLNLGSDPRR